MADKYKRAIEFLTKELKMHNVYYYVNDNPVIPDYEYDRLLNELKDLEEKYPQYALEDSPTKVVGGYANLNDFTGVKHNPPMLSLDNVFNEEELKEWVKGITDKYPKASFYCEPKLDGLALSLTYKGGKLVQAATRGDGVVGEDVTANALTIDDIPFKLGSGEEGLRNNSLVTVRGECFMLKSVLAKLNEKAERSNGTTFSNCRNAAAGSLRTKDPKVTRARELSFYTYGIYWHDFVGLNDLKQERKMQVAVEDNLPYPVELTQRCDTADEIFEYCKSLMSKRNDLIMDIDGVVIKVNETEYQSELGFTGKAPRWATAFKFPPEEIVSTLRNIDYQVGRTGRITPVAKFDVVNVGGVSVTNATLHNPNEMKKKGIYIGANIVVTRRGDVVPAVESVISDGEEHDLPLLPNCCPVCGGATTNPFDDVWACTNTNSCPAQLLGQFINAVSRQALDIDGIGEALLEDLINAGKLSRLGDIYGLTTSDIITLDGYQIKSAKNVIDAINVKRIIPLDKFITALGISRVGKSTAKDLAKAFKTLDNFRKATLEDIKSIYGIGQETADSIISYLTTDTDIEVFLENGVVVEELVEAVVEADINFKDKTFVITGSFEGYSRDDITDSIVSKGGKVAGSVSKRTDVVIVGLNAGSKSKKAESLGLEIWDEVKLKSML